MGRIDHLRLFLVYGLARCRGFRLFPFQGQRRKGLDPTSPMDLIFDSDFLRIQAASQLSHRGIVRNRHVEHVTI